LTADLVDGATVYANYKWEAAVSSASVVDSGTGMNGIAPEVFTVSNPNDPTNTSAALTFGWYQPKWQESRYY
jgi:hypothetical protein